MGWTDVTLLLSDVKIQIVLLLVFFAFLIAIILTVLEFKIKRNREIKVEKKQKNYFEIKILRFVKSNKTSLEKLDFLNKTAKELFNKEFKMPLKSDLSELAEYFSKINEEKISVFCSAMFNAYYAKEEINTQKVHSLAKEFLQIFRDIEEKKQSQLDNSSVGLKNSLISKVENLFFTERNIVRQKKKTEEENNPGVKDKIAAEEKKNKLQPLPVEYKTIEHKKIEHRIRQKIKHRLKSLHKSVKQKLPQKLKNKIAQRKIKQIVKDSQKHDWKKNFENISINKNKLSNLQNAITLKEKDIIRKKLQNLRNISKEESKIDEIKELTKDRNNYLFHS